MKKIIIIGISIMALLGLCQIACAKPLKIENSFGQLVRCGDWINTTNAVVIRNCPELAVLFDLQPEPTGTPSPTSTPEPTAPPVPTATKAPITCEYRFTDTAEGLLLEKVFPIGQTTKTCAYMGAETLKNLFIEQNSVNRSNAFCPVYVLDVTSPSGRRYATQSVQPGLIVDPEVGTWQWNVHPILGSECEKPYALQLLIRTK